MYLSLLCLAGVAALAPTPGAPTRRDILQKTVAAIGAAPVVVREFATF